LRIFFLFNVQKLNNTSFSISATIGDGCTILHSVTLGGTGKDHGDRHPKVGNHVLIGAGSLLLGNIRVGDSAKIGAGSVLLRDIPAYATAVGVPAKIIGRSDEADAGEEVDMNLHHVSLLGRKPSSITTAASSALASMVEPTLEDVSSIGSLSDDGGHFTEPGEESTMQQFKKLEHVGLKKHHEKGRNNKFGLPSEDDQFCPYREYVQVAKMGTPRGTVSILDMMQVMWSESLPNCVIGKCFFELDHAGRGYINVKQFSKEAPLVIHEECNIPVPEATRLVEQIISLASLEA
jgi:carbonic anhydrase/acetyltransferase-like protein (isoleucine patch superfamily)